ncbi:MAG: glycosyltransferase [Acidobacteria bacterium]|nr:glycosyltransferase [Acidobacteriota bacterium]
MRILHISSAKAYGGSERHFADLTRELSRRGHEVFVALRPSCEWQDRLAFVSPERFLHVSIRNSFGMFSARRIAQFAEKNEIDIIHAHIARDYIAASIAARSAKNAASIDSPRMSQPMKSFHRFAFRNVDAAIAVSSSVCDQLERGLSARQSSRHLKWRGPCRDERRRTQSIGPRIP